MEIKKLNDFLLNENVKTKVGEYTTKLNDKDIIIMNEVSEIEEKEVIIYWSVEMDETTEGINSITPVINKVEFKLNGVEQDIDASSVGIITGETLPLFVEYVEYDDETGDFDVYFEE